MVIMILTNDCLCHARRIPGIMKVWTDLWPRRLFAEKPTRLTVLTHSFCPIAGLWILPLRRGSAELFVISAAQNRWPLATGNLSVSVYGPCIK
eukprot:scaffold524828_cov33-Prasinocladus_malaysianus.AAC.1